MSLLISGCKDKVLLITEGLGSGGAERQICGLASFLTEKRINCKLITYTDSHFYEGYLRDRGVEYEYVPKLCNKYTRVFYLILFLMAYKPSCVISFLSSVNLTCCLARIFYKFKLVVSERNNNCKKTFRDIIIYNSYRIADYVVPNSFSQADFIKFNFSFLIEKTLPIVNFVEVDTFVPSIVKKNNNSFRILTVARYSKQKNCLLFLDAVRLLKDKGINVHFDWFGSKSYDEKYVKKLERKVKDLDISDYIDLYDAKNDILVEYQNSDAFLLPSLYEGYPNVIVEAMSCELPVLCSNVFENPFIVKNGEGGYLFDPNNVDEIVSAVEKICKLPEDHLLEMGRLNRLNCIEKNSKSKFISQYMQIIKS